MSAEDDPAELRERVEELEDTIEKMLPTRRAVLAGALGAGAGAAGVYHGTDPASAQASGQVGTSSDPVNVEGYDVTADNSITDAAGVTHTGELADLSDTGGDVENPLTQDLDFAGNAANNVGTFNNSIYPTSDSELRNGFGDNTRAIIKPGVTISFNSIWQPSVSNSQLILQRGGTLKIADNADLSNHFLYFLECEDVDIVLNGTVDCNRQNQGNSTALSARLASFGGTLKNTHIRGSGKIINSQGNRALQIDAEAEQCSIGSGAASPRLRILDHLPNNNSDAAAQANGASGNAPIDTFFNGLAVIGDASGSSLGNDGIVGQINRGGVINCLVKDVGRRGINMAPAGSRDLSTDNFVVSMNNDVVRPSNSDTSIGGDAFTGPNIIANCRAIGNFDGSDDNGFILAQGDQFVTDVVATGFSGNGLKVAQSVSRIGINNFFGYNNDQLQTGDAGLSITSGSEIWASNLHLHDTQGSATQAYGLDVQSGVSNIEVENVFASGNRTSDINVPEAPDIVYDGEAYQSENADTPSGSGVPVATWINFTDTGDGSGNGLYYKDRDGNVQGPI